MPAFTDDERAGLRDALMGQGRRLFTTAGLRKTSLEDLTAPLGIHKTSFYAFFPTKEALYLELLAEEAPGVAQRVVAPALAADDPATGLRLFIVGMAAEYASNPIARRLVEHPDELAQVARRTDAAALERAASAIAPLLSYVESEQRRGRIVARDPAVIVGALQAVTLLVLHRAEIGDRHFDEVYDLVATAVADWLATTSPRGKS